jgi:hypothetical protein
LPYGKGQYAQRVLCIRFHLAHLLLFSRTPGSL